MSWGYNILGSLGDGTIANSFTPVQATGLTNVAQLSAGGSTTCSRLTNGTVQCWGNNDKGQLGGANICPGDAANNGCSTPQLVAGVSGVASVSVGGSHVCVTFPDKTASCWGAGDKGQLSGNTTDATSPGRVVMCEAPPPGCPAPPPTGDTTSIASYQSCSTSVSAGIYFQGTACIATCTAGTSGGWAKCSMSASAGAPVWEVAPCKPDCNSTGLLAVANAVWSCGASVIAGGSCRGSCAAGFGGGLTAVCVGPAWSTTGNCSRVACIGPPPSGAPNATFQCASTPVGEPCVAVCAAGLSGSPRRVCLADGSWGALEGDACVDCAANQPKLTANQASTSVAAGSTAVSVQFTLTAPFIKGATPLLATLDGLTACTTQPAQLTGAAPTPTVITVSCQVVSGIRAGPHKLALTATTTGSNGCSGGSTTTLADILATSAPTPAPSVQLAAAAGPAPSACKAVAGELSTASATFTYAVAPAATSTGGLLLETEVASSAAGAACTATRSGGLERGTLEVTCRGVFDSLTSLGITVTLKASTPGSLKGSATSSQTVAFICCTPATTLAHAVNASPGSGCQTCGANASAVDGVWLKGGLQAGVMRAGAIAASTCSSASSADVGTITTACDAQNSKLIRVTITSPAGSAATKIEFLTRCNIDTVAPSMPSCTAPGPYRWRTVTRTLNSLNVTTGPSGEQTLSFGILLTSTQATCDCGTSFYAIKQTGAFSTGRAVRSSGSCTAAAGTRGKAKPATRLSRGRNGF